MTLIVVVFVAVLGLVVGSFLNVVIWRVPRGESIVRPRSHCPGCATPIRPRDEVPVLSWLLLRGRCRDCAVRISSRYPLVELATMALFAAMALRFIDADGAAEGARVLPAFLYLAAIGIALALIDIDVKRLPDAITLPSYPLAFVLLAGASVLGAGGVPLLRAAIGALIMFAVYFALWFAVPGGMGFGDVKLAGVLGLHLAWLGWDILAVGLLAGWLFGGAFGVVMIASRRGGRKTKVPFGPFMIAGALAAVFFGEAAARVWLGQ